MSKIRKGDEVVVITGKDKGRRGKVEQVLVAAGKVVVEGVNIAKKHQRGNPQAGCGVVPCDCCGCTWCCVGGRRHCRSNSCSRCCY